jgi:penicillin-binding protein 1A
MHRHLSLPTKIFTLLLLGGLAAVLIICATFLYLSPKLPPVDVLREAKLQVPLRIYSQNGELIGEFGEKLRTPIKMEAVPDHFIHALLSAEDDRFLQHHGVDFAGLLRATSQLFSSGRIQSGGSTLTMQVARNFFLSSEQTFLRKFNEIFLALQIERTLSKNEILELYVNKMYFGKRAYGIQAAASVYYGKPIETLNLSQLAMIAGLPKGPSTNNPISNPTRARIRRDWILGRMLKLEYIDEQEWLVATSQPVSAEYHSQQLALDAGYAAEMARAIAIEKLGRAAYTDGYIVRTTINAKQQRSAQHAVVKGLHAYDARHGYRGPEKQLEVNDDEIANKESWLSSLKKMRTIQQLAPAVITGINKPIAEFPSIDLFTANLENDIDIDLMATADEAIDKAVDLKEEQTTEEAQPKEDRIEILLANGSIVEFIWDSKKNPLRLYVNENKRQSNPEKISELLSVGDVIRVRIDQESSAPIISQIPMASAGLVALNPSNGAINALVGGFNFQYSKFNRVTQAYRQTGSNFKPFVYAAALENGFTPASVINDAPIVFADNKLESDWRPENSGGKFYGPTTLRRALYLSRNLVSVRLLRELGINNAIDYLNRFEFSDKALPRDLSLSLGSYAMTPLQVATAYTVLANGGYQIQPHLVTEIEDRKGDIIFSTPIKIACLDCNIDTKINKPTVENEGIDDELEEADSLEALLNNSLVNGNLENNLMDGNSANNEALAFQQPVIETAAKQIVDPRVVYIIDSILQDVIRRGTGTRAKVLGRSDLAGKTGTTNGPTDAWFSGYHPELVATTWLGFDDNQLLGQREYGGSAALPIWIDFMRDSLKGVATATRTQPPGMVSVKINRLTGLPSTANDSQNVFESFLEEYVPEQNPRSSNNSSINQLILDEELF